MVKHTHTIGRQQPTNCLSVFDHFTGLPLKGVRLTTCVIIMPLSGIEKKGT